VFAILAFLLAAIESESDRAFLTALFEENYDAMFRKAKAMLGDAAAAEDAVQDTFVSFARNLDKIYNVPCPVLPFYVVMCIKRRCISMLRQRSRTASHEAGSIDDEAYHFAYPDKGPSVEEQALLSLDVETVERAFSKLPESLKDVLRYKYLLELKDDEIAPLLGVGKDSVRKYVARARQAVYRICEENGYVGKAD
jgi:RNA polymerase sigma factor, sigma-70 family